MQCKCGDRMTERQEELARYWRCESCGRVYAPYHEGRPESKTYNEDGKGSIETLAQIG